MGGFHRGRLSLEYKKMVWEAYLLLERTPEGRVMRGEYTRLRVECGISATELNNIRKDGQNGKFGPGKTEK